MEVQVGEGSRVGNFLHGVVGGVVSHEKLTCLRVPHDDMPSEWVTNGNVSRRKDYGG